MKTIFITGASTGLGRAAALLFAERGWKVIATMRNPDKETALLEIENIKLLPLDVTNLEQIKETVKVALQMGDIDVVFNNAGYGLVGPLEGMTDEQLVNQINTNLLGVIRVTKEFIPDFRQRGKGMFITTTSIGAFVTFPFNSMYHATKWALEGWSESMSFELNPFGIQIKTVSPGIIFTDFVSRSLVLSQHEAYDEMSNKVRSKFSDPKRVENGSTAEQIAEVVYTAATDGKNQHRYLAGNDAIAAYNHRNQVGDEASREGIKGSFLN